jgi:hypothetical protein
MIIKNKGSKAYSIGSPTSKLFPQPIVSNRPPTSKDRAEAGTVWINSNDKTGPSTYIMTVIKAGVSNWVPSYQKPVRVTVAAPSALAAVHATRGIITLTGYSVAPDDVIEFGITNSHVVANDPVMSSVVTNSNNDSALMVVKAETVNQGIVISLWNYSSADATNGTIVLAFDLMK